MTPPATSASALPYPGTAASARRLDALRAEIAWWREGILAKRERV